MALRKIVKIDEEKCNGCGLCIPNCAEGALSIIDGRARLVKDIYCDGLGACLGHCPQDAITIEEREAAEFDERATEEFLKNKGEAVKAHTERTHTGCPGSAVKHFGGGCPGSSVKQFGKENSGCAGSNVKMVKQEDKKEEANVAAGISRLTQWPVQLALVPPSAPYFRNADLLVTADCVPLAYGNYHEEFLKDRAVVMGCPKLDDVAYYEEKLQDIIRINDLRSITVLRMEVPCCGGITGAVKSARDNSGVDIPIRVITIGIEGKIIKREYM